MYEVDNTVIMAAGLSSRFVPLSYERPKGLLVVKGDLLIKRQIRQATSVTIYGVILVPILKGWGFTISLFSVGGWLVPVIFCAAIIGTASYVFYYRAISRIGAAKSMALNIAYVVWAMLFTVIFLRDTSAISFVSVTCALLVITGSILAASDIHVLLKSKDG